MENDSGIETNTRWHKSPIMHPTSNLESHHAVRPFVRQSMDLKGHAAGTVPLSTTVTTYG